MTSFFKTFSAAALYLMANGYSYSAEAKFASAEKTVEVVKSSSGYYSVKEV